LPNQIKVLLHLPLKLQIRLSKFGKDFLSKFCSAKDFDNLTVEDVSQIDKLQKFFYHFFQNGQFLGLVYRTFLNSQVTELYSGRNSTDKIRTLELSHKTT